MTQESRRMLVVGARTGIGEALALRLREEGHEVIAASRDASNPLDVTASQPDFPHIEGALHGLAYCPGSITLKPFANLELEDFRQDFELNVLGAVKTLQHYLPQLKEAKPASVVFFSTVAVQAGMGFHASVAAAKGAVEGMARSLAAEFAPDIRVNVVAPSLTDTPLARRLLRTDKQREAAAKRHPMARVGAADDAAAAAEFLLSPRSAWITGQVVGVDGGLSSLRMI